jgi:phage terminase large subunit GpA-like protein
MTTVLDSPAEVTLAWTRFVDRIRPEPLLLVSEWADHYRILPSKGAAEPGPWRTSRTPYLKAIMDALSTGSPYHTVVFAKGAQIGATETGSNWLGYCIHHAPAPAMMVQPTLDMVKRVSKQRIQPMIDATPVLVERIAPSRARDAGNTLFQKDFPGGTLVMTGANSATGLRSMPARYLFLDEVDAYPGDVEGEGDPVDLAIARTSTFKRNRKIFLCSTPTIEGQSRIWNAFEHTDQQYYYVPCPDCDGYQVIDWKRIIWQEGLPDTAALACEHCGSLIDERHKGMMLDRGQWRATQASADTHTIGFHLSSLYSPPGWYSWADAAREFLAAQGHPTKLQSFINTKLGQCWEERSGEVVDEGGLMSRREIWRAVPDACVALVAGVDCQLDRLEVSIIGFTATEQAKVMHHHKLIGSPAAPEVWRQLDGILKAEYPTDTGRVMNINAACIDSGGLHTKQVYDYVSANTGRRIFAIKGRAGNHPIWPVKLSNKQLRNGARLQLVGVDTAKDAIYSALAVTNPELPKYVSFSMNLPGDYFKQLTVERRVTTYNTKGVRVRVWKKPAGARNEAFDCFVYAVAGLEFLKRHDGRLMQIARQLVQERQKSAEPAKAKPKARTSSAIL